MMQDSKPARDWTRLMREGVAEGMDREKLTNFIADNTEDPRLNSFIGFPKGYHEMIAAWLDTKMQGAPKNA